jgi:isoquinoline 1-oxidoreductase beta subunit
MILLPLKSKEFKKFLKCERPMPHRTSEAVAIIADNYWAALSAKKAVKVQWDNGDLAKTLTTSAYLKNVLKQLLKKV